MNTRRIMFFLLWLGCLVSAPVLSGATPGFVYRNGTRLQLDGRDFYFQGTNVFRLGLTDKFSEDETYRVMKEFAYKGIRVVRLWGFSCGNYHFSGTPIINYARESGINYNTSGLRRLDIALDAAREAGLKVILPMVNFEPSYCGMDWWTQQVIGDSDKQKFYTDPKVRQVYKNHLAYMLNRSNDIYKERQNRSIAYKDDPTIMAIELANEPHTEDWYETHRGITPGQLVYEWLKEMARFIKTIDGNHLIASGEEGYKVSHNWGSEGYRHAWIHNGSKGVDFARNISLPDIDLATVHIYPDNWRIPKDDFWWVEQYLIQDRADIAHRAGKPIIMEESGFSLQSDFTWAGYQGDRRYWLERMYRASNLANYAGTMVWQVVPPHTESSNGYTFSFNEEPAKAIFAQVDVMNARMQGYPICAHESSYPQNAMWGWESGRSCRRPY